MNSSAGVFDWKNYRRVMSVRFNTLSEDDIHVGCDKVLTTLNPTHGKRLWKISSLVYSNQTAAPCGSQPDYLQMFGVHYRCFLRCQIEIGDAGWLYMRLNGNPKFLHICVLIPYLISGDRKTSKSNHRTVSHLCWQLVSTTSTYL